MADALTRAGRFREAIEELVTLHEVSGIAAATRELAGKHAFDLLATGLPFKDAESLWGDVQSKTSWGFLLPALAFKLANSVDRALDAGFQLLLFFKSKDDGVMGLEQPLCQIVARPLIRTYRSPGCGDK